ncbi:hypothetical protein HYW43_00810, partial [Candidatus Daviesbacteria bacterium]|nr:hypothetical protein [Candidatus Daviesbacteria bacterium]
MKKELVFILLLLLISIPAVRSLFIPGGFTSHDLTHHVIRQVDMNRLLSEGQFPPRWSGELNNGFGYPVFLFNYPLPALIGELYHTLGFNFVYSVKAVFFSSMILSVLGMYLFLNSYLGSRLAAFLGACFYLYAPHRFLNVYVAASVGSALGEAILPFVFWAMVEIKQGARYGWLLLGSMFLALMILSHNITTLIFSLPIISFGVILIWQSKNRLELVKKYCLMFLLGFGLSAWFWLPALGEKQYIRFDQIYNQFYQRQFPSLGQLIRSPWGFGLSHPQNPEPGDLSYEIGIIHFLIILFLVPAIFLFKKIRLTGLFTIFFFLLSIFLILKISQPLWAAIPLLYTVQFPLRFSALSVFMASVAAALLIKHLPSSKIIFVCLLILVIYANRNHWRINLPYDPGEQYYLSLKTTTASLDEHLPKWGRAMDKPALSKIEFAEGGGEVKMLEEKSAKVVAQVEATTSSKLRL